MLDAKVDVEFSTKDGITYRKGKFNPKKTDMIVQPTVILNNKFREKGLYKLLNDTERSRLWLTLKKLTVYPLKRRTGGFRFFRLGIMGRRADACRSYSE